MIEFLKVLNEMDQDKDSPGYWRDPNHKNKLDIYVSTTNSYVFEAAKKYGHKIILPYHIYARRGWSDFLKHRSASVPLELDGMEVMIAITPVIRKTEEELKLLDNYALRPVWKKGEVSKVLDDVEYFTYESFDEFIKTLEDDGIRHLLINAVPRAEAKVIIEFIKNYLSIEYTKNAIEAFL